MKAYMIILTDDAQGVVWADSLEDAKHEAIENYGDKCVGVYDEIKKLYIPLKSSRGNFHYIHCCPIGTTGRKAENYESLFVKNEKHKYW